MELSCFFYDPQYVGNLISGSSAFSKSSLNIQKFLDQVLLKPGLESFEHYFASLWNVCNHAVEHSLAMPLLGIGMKTDLFSSVPTTEFSKFSDMLNTAFSQHHILAISQ